MVSCSVINCKNQSGRNKERIIRFFTFPKNIEFKEKWLKICSPTTNSDIGRVCSDHFQPSDYVPNFYKTWLPDYSPKNNRRLKKEAVPSLKETLLENNLDTTKYVLFDGTSVTSQCNRDDCTNKSTENCNVKNLDSVTKNLSIVETPNSTQLKVHLEPVRLNMETALERVNAKLLIENPKNLIEAQGLRYIVSRVAAKYRLKYPHLGKFAKDVPKNEIDKKDWIQTNTTTGYLTVASDEFLQAGNIVEREFIKFHKTKYKDNELSKEPYIFRNLTAIVQQILIKEKITIPEEVLSCLIRTRTYIRLKEWQKRYKIEVKEKPKINADLKQKKKEAKKTLKHVKQSLRV